MNLKGITKDIIAILRVANLFWIYQETIKNDLLQLKEKKDMDLETNLSETS